MGRQVPAGQRGQSHHQLRQDRLRHQLRRQVFAVLRQQLGAFQRLFGFALALAVELITQSLQVAVEQLALSLRQIGAHARQLLAIVGGELRQIQLVDQRLQARGFRLQAKILRLRQRGIAGLRANAALNVVQLTAGVGLLLRKLV